MTDLPGFATAPRNVRSVDFGHVLVLLDYQTGRVQCLLPAAAAQWRETATTGRVASMAPALATQLIGAELLVPALTPAPWPAPVTALAPVASWGGTEHTAGTTRPGAVCSPMAMAALGTVFGIKRAGAPHTAMHRLTAVIKHTTATTRRPATPTEAASAVNSVRRAGWYSPARTACLEESAAAVLLLASRRLSVTWCHGVAPDPVRLHAWVQTADGAPAAEPPSTLAFTPALTLGARHQRQH
ncbi:lasso peptide biosynthesis B2 protein [Streptomyces sp. NPDC048290]|uniref:lasso peptide biosynthesis B2 protein n=1 Tax=Streptomyces sp. NPDC048290 TaxID=3155811 RepID=UPI0034250F07